MNFQYNFLLHSIKPIQCFIRKNSILCDGITNGVKRIIMNQEKSRNALSTKMMTELIDHINSDQDNCDLRVIVLEGKGPAFSAGHDMKELTPEAGRTKHEQVFQLATKLMNSIIDSPVPVIAKVDGMAAAAGCQLVAQCDFVICTPKSTFSTPGVKFGIFCSTPGVALARSVPKMIAMKMLLTGLPISSKEAFQAGLVTQVSDDIEKDLETICDSIKEKSRTVIELGKQFYYTQIRADVKTAYSMAGEVMVENLELNDGQEGVKCFVSKSKPKWTNEKYKN